MIHVADFAALQLGRRVWHWSPSSSCHEFARNCVVWNNSASPPGGASNLAIGGDVWQFHAMI